MSRDLHRRLLLLAADEDAEEALTALGAGPDRVMARRARDLLGRGHDVVTVDGRDGLDPDLLAAASGAVRGGGVLALRMPARPWTNGGWAERLAAWPHGQQDVRTGFMRRLERILPGRAGVVTVAAPGAAPRPQGRATCPAPCASTDQANAVAATVAALEQGVPAVLIADRGRGKSSALGIAAARWDAPVVVTGPSPESAAEVVARADEAGVTVRWCPVGGLRALDPGMSLFVDEAAALPSAVLRELARRHEHIAFATTVHGYEGTGRGFAVRFLPALDRLRPGWARITLDAPIRWAPGDPVEQAIADALVLDAAPSPSPAGPTRIDALAPGALAADDSLLRAVVGLLVEAHYRTRPSDVRRLMDAPNLRVLVARAGSAVAGVLLLAEEGGLDAGAAEAVARGRWRPRGHLLPETLACHLGSRAGATLRSGRIVRIATHPARRREGIGRALIEAATDGVDILGSSFGLDAELLAFWSAAGFRAVRCGIRASPISGLPSAVVLRGISPAGAGVVEALRGRFGAHLPDQLPGALRTLDPGLVLALGAHAPVAQAPDPDAEELVAVAWGPRAFDAAPSATLTLVKTALTDGTLARLPVDDRALLVRKVLQRQPFSDLAGSTPPAPLMRRFRAALRALIRLAAPALVPASDPGAD